MWPRIGSLPTYGVLYFLGTVAHFFVSRSTARRLGLRRRVWIAVSVCYFLGMFFGAKLLYDIRHGQADLAALFRKSHWDAGGLWGGLPAYFVLAGPPALLLSRRRRSALDLVALSTPVPWMFAKLACFTNGCCYGRACSLPWAVTYPEAARNAPAGVPLHPTQIYEMAVMIAMLAIFAALRRGRWRGTMLLWFVGVYGLARAGTDLLRGDADRYLHVGPVTLTQLICLAAATAALLLLIPCRPRQAADT